MTIEGNFNLKPEFRRDMGLPSQFRFEPKERAAKLKAGMTEAQILEQETAVTLRQIEAREKPKNRKAA